MPGHKGADFLGAEPLDITEINGADSLYEADGIIAESEANASSVFGCPTFYSAEGSSQCIRAMLYLIALYARANGKKPLIAANRNVHKTFLTAAAMLDFDVMWLYSKNQGSYLSCDISAEQLDETLGSASQKPAAVYLTSPDYLGNVADIASISVVCRKHGVLLAVDNAHGAYLKFLKVSQHPVDLGADICCDSAHKTLPVLTGGAYLHVSNTAPQIFVNQAKNALSLFGSTSPSYLILQSLDRFNKYISENGEVFSAFSKRVAGFKEDLTKLGFELYGNEPLKITIYTKDFGYIGQHFAGQLATKGIVCEFADKDFCVLMLSPQTGEEGLKRLYNALKEIPRESAVFEQSPSFYKPRKALSVREAVMLPFESVPIEMAEGRILAQPSLSCPPAVPILVCGEVVDNATISLFKYYGIKTCTVVL